jgi:hypothetical protein
MLWALIRPFLAMLVFTIIFGQIARLPSDGTAPLPLDGPRGQTGIWKNSRLMPPNCRRVANPNA